MVFLKEIRVLRWFFLKWFLEDSRQPISSVPSEQSGCLSQWKDLGIQCPLLHWNSLVLLERIGDLLEYMTATVFMRALPAWSIDWSLPTTFFIRVITTIIFSVTSPEAGNTFSVSAHKLIRLAFSVNAATEFIRAIRALRATCGFGNH